MKRFLRWFTAGFLALLLAGFAALLLYISSDSFAEAARSYAVAAMSRATGMDCSIATLEFSLWRGNFHVTGLAMKPAPGRTGRLDLRVGDVRGGFHIRSIWSRSIDLRELTILDPQIRLKTGLEPPSSPGPPGRFQRVIEGSLRFATSRIIIRRGIFVLNDRTIPLDLSLDDFECDLSHQSEPLGFRVAVSYKNGQVLWQGRDIIYDMSARLVLLPSGLQIDSFRISRPHSSFEGKGTLDGWSPPSLTIEASGTVGSEDFYLASPAFSEARGPLAVELGLRLENGALSLQGRFSAVEGGWRRAAFRDLRGSFEIRRGVLRLSGVQGRMGPGSFEVEGALQLAASNPELHDLSVSASAIQLRDAAVALEMPRLAMDNSVDARLRLRWRRGLPDLELDAVAELFGSAEAPGREATPLAGEVTFGYHGGNWVIRDVALRSDHSILVLGEAPEGGSSLHLETDRPEEIFAISQRLSPAADSLFREHPDLGRVTGRFLLDGHLRMSLPDQLAYYGDFRLQQGRWRNVAADSLVAVVRWEGNRLELHSLKIRQADQGMSGSLRVEFPAEEGESASLEAQGDFQKISLSYLRDLEVRLPQGIEGTASGTAQLSLDQGKWSGKGEILLEEPKIRQTELDFFAAEYLLEGPMLRILKAEFGKSSARASAGGTVNLETREMNLAGRLESLPLRELVALRPETVDIDGRLAATVKASGTYDKPDINAEVDLEDLRFSSLNLGKGSGAVRLRDEMLSADLTVRSDLGVLAGRTLISIQPGYVGKAEITLQDWNLEKSVRGNLPSLLSEVSTAMQGRVEIEGSFAEPRTLRAEGELDGLSLKMRDYELRNQGKIRFYVSEAKLRLDLTRIEGEGSNVFLTGEIPLERGSRLDLYLKGNLDLRSMPRLAPELMIGGTTNLEVRVGGTFAFPQVVGRAQVDDLRLAHANLPFSLSTASGRFIFSRNSVAIEQLRGTLSGGSAVFNGNVDFSEAELSSLNLQMSVRNARLPYPQGFRSVVDADMNLRGDRNARVLSGDIQVRRSDYLSDFDILGQMATPSASTQAPVTTSPFLAGTALNINIQSPDGLYIDNSMARVRGRANLRVRGTMAYPMLSGRAEALEGTIFFRGNRFEILRAAADFTEVKPMNPQLDIRAEADVRRYRLRIDVSGDMSDPRLNLTSDPPLPTFEVVLLLTTGISRDDSEGATRSEEEFMRMGAASLLTAGLTEAFDNRVERLFGLESFRVDPYWLGSGKDPTARVTVTQRLSDDFRVTYSRNLSTNEEQVVILEYDVTRNLTLVAIQDEKGDLGLDFRFRKRLRR